MSIDLSMAYPVFPISTDHRVLCSSEALLLCASPSRSLYTMGEKFLVKLAQTSEGLFARLCANARLWLFYFYF